MKPSLFETAFFVPLIMIKFRSYILLLLTFLIVDKIDAQIDHLRTIDVSKSRDAVQLDRSGVEFVEIFCENFANGFDGNNGYGEWFVEDNGGNEIWQEGASGGPSGPLAGSFGPINSPSSENGYALFDADLFNDPSDPQLVSGSITSPSIDMSEMGTVIVDFYQSYLYCCVTESPFKLEVSINNGTEWTVFEAHGDFPEVTNEPSPNNMFTSVDISCLAAGEENVKIKLSFNRQMNPNITHYFWMIDDLCIHENPNEYDVSVLRNTNADLAVDWEFYETLYNQFPDSEPNGGLLVGTILSNDGVNDVEGANLIIDIWNEDQSELLWTVEEEFDLLANVNNLNCPHPLYDTLYVSTGWNPEGESEYWIESTVELNDVPDSSPDNNSVERDIFVNEDFYSSAKGPFPNEVRPDFDEDSGLYENIGFGYFFRPNQEGELVGVDVNFGFNTDFGTEFVLRVMGSNDELVPLDEMPVYTETEFYVEEYMLPDGLSEHFVTLYLDECF